MPRRREVPKRETPADPKHGDKLVGRFINVLMSDGKKSTTKSEDLEAEEARKAMEAKAKMEETTREKMKGKSEVDKKVNKKIKKRVEHDTTRCSRVANVEFANPLAVPNGLDRLANVLDQTGGVRDPI